MGLFDRFFGKLEKTEGKQLSANPAIDKPLSLQVLFPGSWSLQPEKLLEALRSFHPSMAQAAQEIEPETLARGTPLGLAGWEKHVIQLVGFNAPMPSQAVEMCVQPAHYPQDLKERARANQAHVILYYAGHEEKPLEQYAALAAVAGSLANQGALVVLNESARTSFPVAALDASQIKGDSLELLRTLPIPILYSGFLKYEVEGVPGVWMRTHGNHLLQLPDLAYRAEGHQEGGTVFDLFCTILNYLRESGAQLGDGHTMQVGTNLFIKVRAPQKQETFLESEGTLLVVETISEKEINRA